MTTPQPPRSLSESRWASCGALSPQLRQANWCRLVCSTCYWRDAKSSKLKLLPGEFHELMGLPE